MRSVIKYKKTISKTQKKRKRVRGCLCTRPSMAWTPSRAYRDVFTACLVQRQPLTLPPIHI